MRILVFGDVCIDHNQVEASSYESFGGPSVYIDLVLSKFTDVDLKILAKYSEEFKNLYPTKNFLLKKTTLEKNLIYKNIVKNSKRKQFALNTENILFTSDQINNFKEIKDAEIIIFAPLTPNYTFEYVNSILKLAKKESIKIILPQGYFRDFKSDGEVFFSVSENFFPTVNLFDFAIISDEDIPNYKKEILNWLKIGLKNVICTRGKNGASIYYQNLLGKNSSFNIKTKPVRNIVDSTGSGDIFSAIFAYTFFKTKDIAKSVQAGNLFAGICLRYTPLEIFNLKIEDLLENL